ncbi:GNAT family N-acetyltransferase [Paenibacillus sp. IHBB 3054]|uniref:GNAT family N-acetyltransferase n=1 Tax=Paenibacillus sp. IHBB 3054 TaxID=3425689 RepID=UPI003F67E4A2
MTLNLTSRALAQEDLDSICAFVRDAEEVFLVSPKFRYPLTAEQILKVLENRYSPTVIESRDVPEPLAYANLYDKDEESHTIWLGNVIVSPRSRGTGVAAYLIQTMMDTAKQEHGVRTMKLYCHNTNTRALLFYCKQGFSPCGYKVLVKPDGEKLVGIAMQKEL